MKRNGRTSKPRLSESSRDSERDERIARALVKWFRANARDLPWREITEAGTRDAYRSLVSEFMLQQTQVSRVIEKFAPFLERFPTIQELANADENVVLGAWSGLGYYRRARLLHAAAKEIVRNHDGRVPSNARTLREITGIGAYTAGAISSIVFQEREPLADGNVARVTLRLDAVQDASPSTPAVMKRVWKRATELIQTPTGSTQPGALNEAMMELGATVCTPKGPSCSTCPVSAECVSRREGVQHLIPLAKSAMKKKPVVMLSVAIVDSNGRMLLEQRDDKGMWAGLWQSPTFETSGNFSPSVEAALLAQAQEALGLSARLSVIERFHHATTHRDVTVIVAKANIKRKTIGEREWFDAESIAELGISNAQRRVMDIARGS